MSPGNLVLANDADSEDSLARLDDVAAMTLLAIVKADTISALAVLSNILVLVRSKVLSLDRSMAPGCILVACAECADVLVRSTSASLLRCASAETATLDETVLDALRMRVLVTSKENATGSWLSTTRLRSTSALTLAKISRSLPVSLCLR
jgi:hypothetical protein